MNRITGYSNPALGPTRASNSAEKTVAASAPTRATDNQVRQAETALGALVSEGAPVDEARVAEVRAAIAQGLYAIDVDKLAAKMIELDLGGRGA